MDLGNRRRLLGGWDGDAIFLSWEENPKSCLCNRMQLEPADSRVFWLWEVVL